MAKADVLHVNLHDFYGNEQRLNAYLEEAMKQRKLMMLENSQDMIIDALPGMLGMLGMPRMLQVM